MTYQGGEKVDAQPVRDHIRVLFRAGGSVSAIANAAAVEKEVVRRVLNGIPKRGHAPSRTMDRFNAECILRVTPEGMWASVDDVCRVPAVGTQRRVQAMSFDGWGVDEQARRAGLTRSGMDIMLRADNVRADTARAIRRVYAELIDQTPPFATIGNRRAVGRTKSLARSKGWHSSWAWDDDTIDDPQARPITSFERTSAEVIKLGEDTERLLEQGMSVEWVADHFHVKAASVKDALRKYRVAHASAEVLRAKHAAGQHVDQIAAELGVRPGHAFGLIIGTAGTEPVLTDLQIETARLAAEGLPNPEIAARLGVSKRTVESHLTECYRRLGIAGRKQLAGVDLNAVAPILDVTLERSA